MEDYKKAVTAFIEAKKYLLNKDVLGIVLYGSYITGYNNIKSDIDMHIIMSGNTKELIRGSEMHHGYKIEYFEKPIYDIYESIENDFLTQCNSLLPIIGKGIILFDRYGKIKVLQDYILEKFSKPLPPLMGDDAKEMAVIIENRILQISILMEKNSLTFNNNYHLLIEKIRKFYSRLCGCPDIPVVKVERLYKDKEYRDSFCKADIPNEEFIKKYFFAINFEGSNEEKLNIIQNLYNYTTKDLNINPNSYRIHIKSRNNSLNKNHE